MTDKNNQVTYFRKLKQYEEWKITIGSIDRKIEENQEKCR